MLKTILEVRQKINWKLVNISFWIELILAYTMMFRFEYERILIFSSGFPFPFIRFSAGPIEATPLLSSDFNLLILLIDISIMYLIILIGLRIYRFINAPISWKTMNMAFWMELILAYILPFKVDGDMMYSLGFPFHFMSIYKTTVSSTPMMNSHLKILILLVDVIIIYCVIRVITKIYNKYFPNRKQAIQEP